MLNRQIVAGAMTFGLLTCATAVLTPLEAQLRTEVLEQVLVRVNGEIISKTEFEARQVAELRQRPELANVTPSSLDLQKAIAEITPQLIVEAVDELLLVQRGREQGWALSDEQFGQIVANIKSANDLEDEERFKAALLQEGLTEADLRVNVERSMLVQQVQRVEVFDRINVTEDEARAYYESNRQTFTTPTEITLREILFEVPTTDQGVNVAQDDEMRARAEAVRERVLKGEPFPQLAGEFSASASRANGGLVGPLSRDDLAPQLQTLLDEMQVGDITEVLRTPRGYQLLKLESRTESSVRPFDDARADIGRQVAEQKATGEMLRYLDRLREQATIVWRNEELEKAYERGLAERQREPDVAAASPRG